MNSPGRLPENLQSASQLVRSVIAEALAPNPDLLVAEWADRFRRLSTKASSEAGEWRTERTPYLREIMNAMSPSHPATDGDFMKGTQIGGSEALYNAIGYTIDMVPCPMMLVMPTVDTAKVISQQRLQPMIDDTPALCKKLGDQKSRDSTNTQLRKDFPGGLLLIRGANSGPGLRSTPVRVLFMDEIDAYPDDVDGEGDPCTVVEKRTDQFGARAKRFACSSPKIKGESRIDRRYQRGTRGKYFVPCPHCAHEQILLWAQVRWEMEKRRELVCAGCAAVTELHDQVPHACAHCSLPVDAASIRDRTTDEVADAWYECSACSARIDEHYKTLMLERGRWIHEQPGIGDVLADDDLHPHAIWAQVSGKVRRYLPRYRRPLSWHLPALYSPLGWFSWRRAVEQKLEAEKGGYNEQTGESLLQVFHNTVLGEAFEVKGEQPKVNLIKQRVDAYALGTVPHGALLLHGGVDVQGDRIEVEIDGYGRDEECWVVDHQIIHGDPTKHGAGSVWAGLKDMLDKDYPHASGETMRVTSMAVDSGYHTQEVYDFSRKHVRRHVIATKGANESGKPILARPAWMDINHAGQKLKKGVQMWLIGTDPAKERLYKRLDLEKPEGWAGEPIPAYQHFPRGLPDEYFEQLVSEKLIRRRVKGVEKHEWIKTRERNEALDLKILCYAAFIYAGGQRRNWDALERAVKPIPQAVVVPATEDAPVPREVARQIPPSNGWIPQRANWLQR